MRKWLVLSLALILSGMSIVAVAASPSLTQSTCPNSGDWTKIDNGNLENGNPVGYPVSGAIEYCFKAGSDNSQGCTGGLFDSWPLPDGACGLSHWSYRLGDEPTETPVTPTPTETPVTPTPTDPTPTEPTPTEPTPTKTPEPTETPRPTPTEPACDPNKKVWIWDLYGPNGEHYFIRDRNYDGTYSAPGLAMQQYYLGCDWYPASVGGHYVTSCDIDYLYWSDLPAYCGGGKCELPDITQ